MAKLMKLNVGCGQKQREGYVNLDAEDYGQEVVGDLLIYMMTESKARPGEWDEIMAEHCIEHFPPEEVEVIFNMAWKMLKPNGLFKIVVPSVHHDRAFILGHRTFFTKGTFVDLARDYQKRMAQWEAEKIVENSRHDIHAWMRKKVIK